MFYLIYLYDRKSQKYGVEPGIESGISLAGQAECSPTKLSEK